MPDATPELRKAGSAREATLNHALDGTGTPRMPLADSRGLARQAYDHLELPRWRRSGFWTTSLQDLDLERLEIRTHGPDASPPALTAIASPSAPPWRPASLTTNSLRPLHGVLRLPISWST